MAEIELNTRIQLKYDTLENWNNIAESFIPKKGEVCIAEITREEDIKPQYLIKVGDGKNTWRELDWVSAKAADVYDWAKAITKPTYTASEVGAVPKTGGTFDGPITLHGNPTEPLHAATKQYVDNRDNVLIENSSIRMEQNQANTNIIDYYINVKVLSGALQAGDKIQLCKSVKKHKHNINKTTGIRENDRVLYKIVPFASYTISLADLDAATTNVYSLHVDSTNKNLYRSYCSGGGDSILSGHRKPLTLRICRPKQISNNREKSYIQISNTLKLAVDCNTKLIQPI